MRLILSVMTFLVIFSTVSFAADQEQPITPERKAQFHKIIREYLLENPEILPEVAQRYQQKQQEVLQKRAEQAIKDNVQTLFKDQDSPVAGNPKGKVVLVEFFDYQCGHCKRMTPVIEALIDANKEVKIIFKELPIFGEGSAYASQMALAAQQQDKYQDLHNAFMNEPAKLSKNKVKELAATVGLDADKLESSEAMAKFQQQISNNKTLAQRLGIRGTPAFVLATNVGQPNMQVVFIPGAASSFRLQSAIDELKKISDKKSS